MRLAAVEPFLNAEELLLLRQLGELEHLLSTCASILRNPRQTSDTLTRESLRLAQDLDVFLSASEGELGAALRELPFKDVNESGCVCRDALTRGVGLRHEADRLIEALELYPSLAVMLTRLEAEFSRTMPTTWRTIDFSSLRSTLERTPDRDTLQRLGIEARSLAGALGELRDAMLAELRRLAPAIRSAHSDGVSESIDLELELARFRGEARARAVQATATAARSIVESAARHVTHLTVTRAEDFVSVARRSTRSVPADDELRAWHTLHVIERRGRTKSGAGRKTRTAKRKRKGGA